MPLTRPPGHGSPTLRRKIYAWCRGWNLQEADAEDVTQSVLLKLADKLQSFEYDPAKAFGRGSKHYAPCLERSLVEPQGDRRDRGSQVWSYSRQSRPGRSGRRSTIIRSRITRRSHGPRRTRVLPRTWQAFERTAIQGQSGAEAAKVLGMKVATIFVARSKVQNMIQEELRKLDEPQELKAPT